VADLAPKNIALLAERDRLQTELDAWHKANPGPITDMKAYRAFLEKIGYLVPVPKKVKATTKNVDAELAKQAGPQLVVPITNARYALNAANARWGSLYDALYGTDVISEELRLRERQGLQPEKRGAKVIEYARHVLDRTAPLKKGSHLSTPPGTASGDGQLVVTLKNGKTTGLRTPANSPATRARPRAFISAAAAQRPAHGHHHQPHHGIGKTDAAGVSDLVVEAALSTILDLEDSVAVVDADDKVLAYSNWLGILQGTLTESVTKGGKTFTRGLNPDREYTAPMARANLWCCTAAR
jgi:malate synthase